MSKLDLSDLYNSLEKENNKDDEIYELPDWLSSESEHGFSMDILRESPPKLAVEGKLNGRPSEEKEIDEICNEPSSGEANVNNENYEYYEYSGSDEDSESDENSESDEDNGNQYNLKNEKDGKSDEEFKGYKFAEPYTNSLLNSIAADTDQYNKIDLPEKLTESKTLFELRKEVIYEMIASDIGSKWRKFGGGIEIKEGEMDKLEEEFPNEIKKRVLEMFEKLEYKEFYDLQRVYYKIVKSLDENCRHYDLSNRVQLALIQ
ncbi:uncharacterized protein LOC129609164 [Condylostylus longicornis]|uniref:uncharacterized protein LOC129609164 n=1 Tax=Condylostylus longicornis TaxID=2530218 RepID=UPI00244E0CE2|nr:uncharacterized protein LOC129609164 [Condylostylus longicornis]